MRWLKFTPFALIALNAIWKSQQPGPLWVREHILYNAIWILALTLCLFAPVKIDRLLVALLVLAIFMWGAGSFLASMAEFADSESYLNLASQISYAFFYPLLLLAAPRIAGKRSKISQVEALDALIFGLGFTSITAALFLATVFRGSFIRSSDQFFLIFYPVGDIGLLLVSLFLVARHQINKQLLIFIAGVFIFAATDLNYLYLTVHNKYHFGALTDDGWLCGVALLALALHFPALENSIERNIHPMLIALSIIMSPALLGLGALVPGLFPVYVIIPSIANLLLAFIRMNGAIRHARALSEERILARTDELTGLPNRRKFIVDIESFTSSAGALLLLDLNRFKPINDQYGHEMGDLVLKEVARRFTRVVPDGDLLARLGGDEFGALIHGNIDHIFEIAYALHATLQYPFRIRGHEISLGVSIGFAENDGNGRLLERADVAMYEAKRREVAVVNSSEL